MIMKSFDQIDKLNTTNFLLMVGQRIMHQNQYYSHTVFTITDIQFLFSVMRTKNLSLKKRKKERAQDTEILDDRDKKMMGVIIDKFSE